MKRWFILIASIVLQIILGGIYAWSVFIPALRADYGISVSRSSLVFGITILVFTLSMIVAGRILARKGPRFTAVIGALFYGTGYLVASLSGGNYWIILMGIGVITGAGIGFGYVCPLTTCVKWFPRKKGLITGLAVAGFGGGAIILTEFVSLLENMGLGTLMIYRNIAIFTGIPAVIAAYILTNPPGFEREQTTDQKITEYFKHRVVIAMRIGLFSGIFGGPMVVSNIRQIGLSNQLAEGYAGLAISLFAVGNALGRVLWGTIFDKFGRSSIPVSLVVLGSSALLMLSRLPVVFNIGAVLTGIAFGGCFVLYFLRIVEEFESRAGQIYPYVFLAYGISAVSGPALGGYIYDVTGTYWLALYSLLAITIIGAMFLYQLDRTT
ncbi:MAG: MFS transporter [Bacillota bacterium]